MQSLVEQYRLEHDVPAVEIAAALALMAMGDKPLLMQPDKKRLPFDTEATRPRKERGEPRRDKPLPSPDKDMERFRIEVGYEHGVKPGNIVGAIANEAGLDGEHIGHISIEEDFSLVDLPVGMPRDIFMDLKKVRVCGRPMKISVFGKPDRPKARKRTKPKRRS